MTTNPPSANPLEESEYTPPVGEKGKIWTPRWIGALVVVVMLGELATFSYSLVGPRSRVSACTSRQLIWAGRSPSRTLSPRLPSQ